MLEKAVGSIDLALRDIELDLPPSKTLFIYFNRRGVKPGASKIRIRNRIIKSSVSVRFLGVVFDYRMAFDNQVDIVRKKCFRAINIIRFLCGT